MKTVIIIPARMSSKRFPDKPLALIDGIPMIQRVWEQAIKSNIGEVFVACSEKVVFDLISQIGGKAIMTDPNLQSGTDRIYEALIKISNFQSFDYIINLQGDMPLINPSDILKVNEPLINGFDIGTLATNLSLDQENNQNITKVKIEWIKEYSIGIGKNFYKISKGKMDNIYHHVGIYSYSFKSLKKFVSLKPTANELNHKLEQLRALDSNMSIGVSYAKNVAISVDTKEDLIHIESVINKSND